ncbi:hypothetical protein EVAR_32963_1 [Eumeta japonica]|uniref:Uncharacterized protein n=1 Tax=Eumeta variegata TaxID=151549 RepID=A0A4C1WWJ0_EUMVA|nr:hypothetical protein EVAR_32963_1 [Eumeta japonica]
MGYSRERAMGYRHSLPSIFVPGPTFPHTMYKKFLYDDTFSHIGRASAFRRARGPSPSVPRREYKWCVA